jgi:hypothetical protein
LERERGGSVWVDWKWVMDECCEGAGESAGSMRWKRGR